MLRLAQAAFSAALISYSVWLGIDVILDRNEIHPFTSMGWAREQLCISYGLFTLGFISAIALTAKTRGLELFQIAVSLLIFLCSAEVFLRHFEMSMAIFATLALLNAALLCWLTKQLSLLAKAVMLPILFALLAVSLYLAGLNFVP
jgi:hypothetical protein